MEELIMSEQTSDMGLLERLSNISEYISPLKIDQNVRFSYDMKIFNATPANMVTNITELNIPEGITTIPSDVETKVSSLNVYTDLQKVTFPSTLTTLSAYSMYNMTKLSKVEFRDCESLSIGDCSFCGCTNLTDICIPDGTVSIAPSAFRSCQNLTHVTSESPDKIVKVQVVSTQGEHTLAYGSDRLKSIDVILDMSDVSGLVYIQNKSLTDLRLINVSCDLELSWSYWDYYEDPDTLKDYDTFYTYATPLTTESLVWILNELLPGDTTRTMRLGPLYRERAIFSWYCKITDPSDPKLPMVICSSTDDGAMTIAEYTSLKKWEVNSEVWDSDIGSYVRG